MTGLEFALILGVIVLIGGGLFASMRRIKQPDPFPKLNAPHPAEMTPEARRILKPFLQLEDDVRALIVDKGNSPMLKALSTEAMNEVQATKRQVLELIDQRESLTQALKKRSTIDVEIVRAQDRLKGAADEETRTELHDKLDRLQSERSAFDSVERSLQQLDRAVSLTEQQLSSLRTKLAADSALEKQDPMLEERLTQMVNDMKAVEAAMNEAKSMEMEDLK